MKQALKAFSLIALISFSSIAQAAAPLMYRCVDVVSKRGFQFEIPANGLGMLKVDPGVPVRSRGECKITAFGSKTTFRFGSEIEGGMFRNGIFYYHRHDTGSGTKIINGTCRLI